jgi:hypothetical protein
MKKREMTAHDNRLFFRQAGSPGSPAPQIRE